MSRNLLYTHHFQLLKALCNDFPYLVKIAKETRRAGAFKRELKEHLLHTCGNEGSSGKAMEDILLLIEYDGKTIPELSTGESLHIESITYLWHFLNGDPDNAVSTDVLLDLYHYFKRLSGPDKRVEPDPSLLKKQMMRWPSGNDPGVQEIREANKKRMIPFLIRKIERRNIAGSRFTFPPEAGDGEKYQLVEQWWNSYVFHLAMAVKEPVELNIFLGNTLSEHTMKLLLRAKRKGIPFFITPYYLSLLNPGKTGYNDEAIRSYILYSEELINTYGSIKAWEKEDIIIEGEPNAAGWLLPEGHNIHRRYPEVAILIPDSMGRACGGICASCQRMYGFQSKQLNFDFEALKPKETWDKKLRRLMEYFEQDSQLRDILITGGDAFMSQDTTLRKILDAVYKMALRKQKANESRPEGEKFAQIQRVRLGSRLLAYLPIRITPELVSILKEFREKALTAGISQFIIQTHFQSPLEVTPEALQAIKAINAAGWNITNQLVYTVAASRKGHTAKLRRILNKAGVICYYTFSVKGFNENYAMFAPNSRSLQEQAEEKVFGRIPPEKTEDFMQIIRKGGETGKHISAFLKENDLPFAATDRNVLNLPAIGKSMTFTTVGITKEGRRILKFEHDSQRRHSPVIDNMGEVYIVENKSVAAYLRQLEELGENIKEYASIWNYTRGTTEPRFRFYEYPPYTFRITQAMTHIQPAQGQDK